MTDTGHGAVVQPKQISVLIEQSGEWWVAQCVEHDFVTQARTVAELLNEIEHMLIAHICSCEEYGIEPFQVPPAPREVRERFERLTGPRLQAEFSSDRIPKLFIRIA